MDCQEVRSQFYVDNMFIDPTILKNKGHANFNNNSLDCVRFVEDTSYPTLREHLTAKCFVDKVIINSVDEPSLVRLDPEEKLKKEKQNSTMLISILTSPKTIIQTPTKAHVDSLSENG